MQVVHWFDVPPHALVATLVDPAFLSARAARYGEIGTPRLDPCGEDVVVVTHWQLPVRRVPGGIRRYVRDGRIVQVDRWSLTGRDCATCSVEVDAGRMPVVITGSHRVTTADRGSRYAVDVHVAVDVPVVGRRLAGELSRYLSHLIDVELGFLDDFVAARRQAS